MLSNHEKLKHFQVAFLKTIAEKTEGFSQREISTVISQAFVEGPLAMLFKAQHFKDVEISNKQMFYPCICESDTCGVKTTHSDIQNDSLAIPQITWKRLVKTVSDFQPTNREDIISENISFHGKEQTTSTVGYNSGMESIQILEEDREERKMESQKPILRHKNDKVLLISLVVCLITGSIVIIIVIAVLYS